MRWRGLPGVLSLVAGLGACSDHGPTVPAPSLGPTPSLSAPAIVVGPASGPTRVELLAQDPPVGSTIGGCGPSPEGCAGRIRMTFRVTPTGSGTVLQYVGFLHATTKAACLLGRVGKGSLRAGEPQTVEIVFDEPAVTDHCRVPLDIVNLAFNVEGTIEVASRQEWALAYHLTP